MTVLPTECQLENEFHMVEFILVSFFYVFGFFFSSPSASPMFLWGLLKVLLCDQFCDAWYNC